MDILSFPEEMEGLKEGSRITYQVRAIHSDRTPTRASTVHLVCSLTDLLNVGSFDIRPIRLALVL